ncbi:MAG: J domain-containing protein [Chloroflexi bacterium]|nr:J domain-containing protein [Chloroflexota bacterium]
MREQWDLEWKDYYAILQISRKAEPEVIEAAYNRLARKYHPDVNRGPDANRRMLEFNEAFEVLSDARRKESYDAAWDYKMGASSTPKTPPRPKPPPPPKPPKPKVEIDPPAIELRDLPKGDSPIIAFVIKNSGGPWTSLGVCIPRDPKHPKYDPHHWLSMYSSEALYPPSKLPLRVRLKVETAGLREGLLHHAEVIVSLDDETAKVDVSVTVAAPADDIAPKPSAGWFFSWLAPGWQLFLALSAAVGGIQLIFHPNPWFTIPGVAIIGTTLYSLTETNWLKQVSSANSIVKVVGAATIFAGLLTAIAEFVFWGPVTLGLLVLVGIASAAAARLVKA